MSGIGGMVSAVHTQADIEATLVAFKGALEAVVGEYPDLIPT